MTQSTGWLMHRTNLAAAEASSCTMQVDEQRSSFVSWNSKTATESAPLDLAHPQSPFDNLTLTLSNSPAASHPLSRDLNPLPNHHNQSPAAGARE